MRGGPGDDELIGGSGSDSMEGGPGADLLVGITGDYTTAPATDTSGADTLEGWEGSDTIVLGTGDHGYGEFGAASADGLGDTFVLGTWIGSPAPVIHDFDPAVDDIEIYYDSGAVADDTVIISSVDVAGDITYFITFDGDVLAEIPMGMTGNVLTLAQVTAIDVA